MISIIIPTKNHPDLLHQCVGSIRQHCGGEFRDYEILVVDTGDGCDANGISGIWSRHLPEATFAVACNAAALAAEDSDYFLLLNNDTIIGDDLISAYVSALRDYGASTIIGVRLLYPDRLVQHAGIGFDNEGGPYNLWRLAPAEHPQVSARRFLPAVTFACAMIPRHVWEELGGLDESYVNAYEDVDFCLRAREIGYRVVYEPSITVTHLEGQTEGRNNHVAESWEHYREVWVTTGRIHYALGFWPFSVAKGGQ